MKRRSSQPHTRDLLLCSAIETLIYRSCSSMTAAPTPLPASQQTLQVRIRGSTRCCFRAWSGFRQVGIAYERDTRAAGVTKYPLHRLIKLAFDGIFNFSTTPLTAVFVGGLLMSSISFIALLLVLVFRIFDIPILGMRASYVQGFSSTILTIANWRDTADKHRCIGRVHRAYLY